MRNPRPSFFIVHPSLTLDRRPLLFIFHCSLFILLSLFILHSSFFITGCTKSTSPKTGSLSGRVILVNDTDDPSLDPVDFSGVTVALYELAVLDTTIVRINHEYPQIGVQISQETEFDHRLQYPVKVVTSNAEGDYDFNRILCGVYNLVFIKDGWGPMYAHNVKVDVVGNEVQGSVMYPTTMINGTIANPYVFLANHTYIVNDQLLLVSECEFQRGTKVYISPNSSVVIYGNVSVSGTSGHVWVSSADSLFGRRMKTTIDCFDKLSFMGDYDYDIEDFIVTFGTNGVNVSGHTAHVTGCLFRNMISAGLVSQSESIFVSNSLFIDNSDKGIYSINDTNIQRIVMIRNHNGIYLNDAFGQIASSYFYDNFIAIRPTYQGVSIVGNCLLDNKYGVSLSASNSTISSNIFSHNEVALETNRSYVGVGSYAYCSPTLSDNNFYGTDVYISLKGQNPVGTGISNATGVNANQHYPDNYFESNELTYHLIDSNHPGSGVLYSINYLPRRLAANPSAGIQ